MKRHNIKKLLICTCVITLISTSQLLAKTSKKLPVVISQKVLIQPYWNETASVNVYLTTSGSTLSSALQISAFSDSKKITGTLYLQKKSNGRWANVTSWKINGTGDVDMEHTYKGISGVTYRLKVVVKVGTESITEYSNEAEI